MFTKSLKAALALVASSALLSTPVLAALGRTTLFKDGLSPHVDASFWSNLTPTQSTWDQWGWGWIPQRCFDEANSNGLSPYDIEVFNVHYTDCGSAFVFCRHHNAALSQIDMIDLFGRLPIHERQWIQHVVALPGNGDAYMSAAVVVFRGSVGTPSVFQHEVGHSVDFYKDRTGEGQSSATSRFNDAIYADSCVPDDYSNSNNVEDYTQVGVLVLYDIVNPGGLNGIGANWNCLNNQKVALEYYQKEDMIPGGTCSRRWADSTIVSMGPATGNSKMVRKEAKAPKPAAALTADMPNVYEINDKHVSQVTTYKNLVFNATEKAAAVERQGAWARKATRGKRSERFNTV